MKFSLIVILVAICSLSLPDRIVAKKGYPSKAKYYPATPTDTYVKPDGCQEFLQLCPTGNGPYKCCPPNVCRRSTKLGGASVCLPPWLVLPDIEENEESEQQMCRNELELCIPYGDYSCCEGFNCVGTDDPVNPVGAGICLAIGSEHKATNKCRGVHQLCQPYGQYKCCQGFVCADTRSVSGKAPPGVGFCIPA